MSPNGPTRTTPATILVLDTSLVGVAMALVRVGSGSAEMLWHGAHADNAGSVPAISGLLVDGLAAVKASMGTIEGVVVSRGPGSFTGIKIGLAFVLGLRRARLGRLPVLGTAAIAAAATRYGRELGTPYGLLLPATRTHGYLALTGEGPRLLDASAPGAFSALTAGMPLAVSGRWPMAEERARAAGHSVLQIAPSDVSSQAIYGMSEEAGRVWPAGFDSAAPEPRYLRLSTAEERLAGARGDIL